MPKFIIHWRIFDQRGASIIEVDADERRSALQRQSLAQTAAYDALHEVFESNSSRGAVPLTAETAREYGVPFEEEAK